MENVQREIDELNVAEHDRYGKGSVMVWKGINVNGKTDLHAIENGTLIALSYCNELRDLFVRPYAGSLGQEPIMMDDNAGLHHAHVTDAYLEHKNVKIQSARITYVTSNFGGAQTFAVATRECVDI